METIRRIFCKKEWQLSDIFHCATSGQLTQLTDVYRSLLLTMQPSDILSAKDEYDCTLFQLCSINGHFECLQFLLSLKPEIVNSHEVINYEGSQKHSALFLR